MTAIIENLITETGVTEFYVGHQGQFDNMAYSVLKELKVKYPHIRYSVVLAYMPDSYIKEVYVEDTLFPDGMESVPKKYAISKRNDWMIQHSGFAVRYVHKITGGAVKFRYKTERKRSRIIDVLKIERPNYSQVITYRNGSEGIG